MDKDIKEFIIENKNLIDQNDWVEIYSKAMHEYHAGFVGTLTSTLVDAGINPLDDLTIIPLYYYYNQPIREFIIPNNIVKIDSYAFGQCKDLYKITIPESVKTIQAKAFYYVESLKDIYYQGTKDQWQHIEKQSPYLFMIPEHYTIHCSDGDITY